MSYYEDPQIDALDLGTINAERRKYLLECLRSQESVESDISKEDIPGSSGTSKSSQHQDFDGAWMKEEIVKRKPPPRKSVPGKRMSTTGAPVSTRPPPESSNDQSKRHSVGAVSSSSESGSGSGSSSSKSSNKKPLFSLKFFRNNFGSSSSGKTTSGTSSSVEEVEINAEDLKKVTVDHLPQSFIAKYLGKHPARGVYGIESVRRPIDKLMENVGRLPSGSDLPLVQVDVLDRGVSVHSHSQTKTPYPTNFFPIEYVSYGVQDTKFCRIFALVLVNEMSKTGAKTEAHCFVCASPLVARKLALSLAFSFRQMRGSLERHTRRVFSVDLRADDYHQYESIDSAANNYNSCNPQTEDEYNVYDYEEDA